MTSSSSDEGLLASDTSTEKLRVLLKTQYERWWNLYVDPIRSKWHFLRYWRGTFDAHRLLSIDSQDHGWEVEFLTKDLKQSGS